MTWIFCEPVHLWNYWRWNNTYWKSGWGILRLNFGNSCLNQNIQTYGKFLVVYFRFLTQLITVNLCTPPCSRNIVHSRPILNLCMYVWLFMKYKRLDCVSLWPHNIMSLNEIRGMSLFNRLAWVLRGLVRRSLMWSGWTNSFDREILDDRLLDLENASAWASPSLWCNVAAQVVPSFHNN